MYERLFTFYRSREHMANIPSLVLPILLALSAPAAAQSFDSGTGPVGLLELFTSQGCSSCPPAERWLSRLKGDSGLWTRVVPVAFHVDYWDDLGWRDPHANARFSQRQWQYQRSGAVSGVYTPGFVLAGHEWRDWTRAAAIELPAAGPPGRLQLDLGDAAAVARFSPAGNAGPGSYVLHLVRLGFDLETPVPTGENRGRRLREDFVALDWQSAPMQRRGATWEAEIGFQRKPVAGSGRQALAAWVSTAADPRPLQALGGWLTD